jgi:RNA polymerase sigma-70 factor (ECF subfamily)
MEAVMERAASAAKATPAAVFGTGPDPMGEVNAPEFLKALLGGPPTASQAFRRMVEAIHPHLARYVGRHFRDPDLIQDVLQEVFLAAHRSLPRFEGKSKLTTWLYSLAYHKVCDCFAEKYRMGRAESGPWGPEWEMESPAPLPDESLHQSRLIRWIEEAAEGIPKLYREPYRLRDVEGLNGDEAAAALGISPTLVRVRLHRARCLIVERIRKRYPAAFAEGNPF